MDRWVAICEGTLDPSTLVCDGTWLTVSAQGIPGAFDFSTLDPAILAACFGLGFITLGILFAMAKGAAVLLDMISPGMR